MSSLYPKEQLSQDFPNRIPEFWPGSLETLHILLDEVFFASLMIDEGEPVRFAIVYCAEGIEALKNTTDSDVQPWGKDGPPYAWDVTALTPRQLNAKALAKFSVGLKYGTHLIVVSGVETELQIVGFARRNLHTDGGDTIRIAAPKPGTIVIENYDNEVFRFEAEASKNKTFEVMDSQCPVRGKVHKILAPSKVRIKSDYWMLVELLRQIRLRRHGAILAIGLQVPSEAVLSEVTYRYSDPRLLEQRIDNDVDTLFKWLGSSIVFSTNEHKDKIKRTNVETYLKEKDNHRNARTLIESAIEDIAHLSAIDGAVLIGHNFKIYGAGYKIPSQPGTKPPLKALTIEGSQTTSLPNHYGARHKAAYSFANENDDNVAFVVSEDGPVSCATKLGDAVVVWSVRIPET